MSYGMFTYPFQTHKMSVLCLYKAHKTALAQISMIATKSSCSHLLSLQHRIRCAWSLKQTFLENLNPLKICHLVQETCFIFLLVGFMKLPLAMIYKEEAASNKTMLIGKIQQMSSGIWHSTTGFIPPIIWMQGWKVIKTLTKAISGPFLPGKDRMNWCIESESQVWYKLEVFRF